MARTEEQDQKDMEAYAAAFGEDMKQTETDEFADEGAGVTPEAGAAMTETEEQPVEGDGASVESASEPVEEEAAPAEPVAAEAPAGEEMAAEAPAGDDEMSDVPPEDAQAYKSWRGRLKKREEELAAREAALSGQGESSAEEMAEGQASLDMGGEEQAPSGDVSFDEAVQNIRDSFGEEFESYIKAAVKGYVEQAIGSSSSEAIEAIKALNDRFESNSEGEHVEYILDAHPDLYEVTGTPEFQQWLGDKPEMQECCEHGTKRAVVRMLNAFKESQKQADNDEGLDDLTAVQSSSSGVVIPEKKAQGDFEGAWSEF